MTKIAVNKAILNFFWQYTIKSKIVNSMVLFTFLKDFAQQHCEDDGITYSYFGQKKSTETVVGRSPPDHNEKFPEPHSHHALQPKFVAIQTG